MLFVVPRACYAKALLHVLDGRSQSVILGWGWWVWWLAVRHHTVRSTSIVWGRSWCMIWKSWGHAAIQLVGMATGGTAGKCSVFNGLRPEQASVRERDLRLHSHVGSQFSDWAVHKGGRVADDSIASDGGIKLKQAIRCGSRQQAYARKCLALNIDVLIQWDLEL